MHVQPNFFSCSHILISLRPLSPDAVAEVEKTKIARPCLLRPKSPNPTWTTTSYPVRRRVRGHDGWFLLPTQIWVGKRISGLVIETMTCRGLRATAWLVQSEVHSCFGPVTVLRATWTTTITQYVGWHSSPCGTSRRRVVTAPSCFAFAVATSEEARTAARPGRESCPSRITWLLCRLHERGPCPRHMLTSGSCFAICNPLSLSCDGEMES